MAENFWMYLIGHPTKRRFEDEFTADRTGMWERVKEDWHGLKHRLV